MVKAVPDAHVSAVARFVDRNRPPFEAKLTVGSGSDLGEYHRLVSHQQQSRAFDRGLLEASTGREGIAEAGMRNPDLILLDLGLPDADGIDVAKQLREFTAMPIIVLSARDQDRDKVAVLDAGADDYLTKPFSVSELLARIRVAHRHAERKASGKERLTFVVGPLRVDLDKREVLLHEQRVSLTPNEYKLLAVLVRNAGRVVTHQQLLKEVWGIRVGTQRQYLHVAMGQLRHKLEAEPARPRLLRTELGVGYRLQAD